jgi:hypothetical protein
MGGFATVRSATARPKTGHSSFGSIWPRAACLLWGARYEKADVDGAQLLRQLVTDAVEKVENRTTPKISQMVIFGLPRRYDAL